MIDLLSLSLERATHAGLLVKRHNPVSSMPLRREQITKLALGRAQ